MHFKTSTSNICHKHQQEIYVKLVHFGYLCPGAVEQMHWKKKICDKNLFSGSVEWSSEKLWKMILPDVKTKIKQ